jgi:CelD/BcsL family acetyltransferase involved in cellulose biosynthesis
MQRAIGTLTNPFLCPEFSVGVGQFRPSARIAVLTEGPEIVGFFPFERRRLGVGIPIGADLNNCQGLIHAPALDWEPREVLKASKVSTWQFDNLIPGQIPFERYAVAKVPSAAIDLADGFDAYRDKLRTNSPKFWNSLRRRRKNLQRDFGEIRFEESSCNLDALRLIMKWKSEQCRRNGWVDIFDRRWIVDLVYYLLSTRSDSFSLSVSLLYSGETPIAGQFSLRSGGIYAGWFTAYDSEFSCYSPGLIHAVQLIEALAKGGVHTIDLGGTAAYQDKLKNHDMFFAKGMVTRGPLAAGAHRIRIASAHVARREIRRFPPAYRAAEKVLRLYGRTS